MATQRFIDVEDILKEWYAPAIVNQIYVKSPVWSQVKKSSKGVSGKRVYIPLRHTLSEAVGGNVSGTNTLPTAGKIGYDSTYIWQKRNYGRVRVDGYGIEASKGKGGWIDLFAGETRGIAESFAIDIDQQVMGRGTGILGVSESTRSTGGGVSNDTLQVDDPHGIHPAEATPGYFWFRKGMLIDIWNYASGTTPGQADAEIESIDPANNTVTFTAAATQYADGDYLTRANTGVFDTGIAPNDAHAVGNGVIMGIDRIIDDDTALQTPDMTNFQGITASSATYNWWRAQRMGASADTILTEMKIQVDLDTIEQNTDGDAPNLALTTYALRNKLIEIVKSDRMLQSLKLVGGWEAIKYRGGSVSLPIMVHKFCPTGYWYYLNLKYLTFYTLKKLIWDNKGGGIIKPVADQDEYEAWFKMFGNLGVDKRNAMGKHMRYTTS